MSVALGLDGVGNAETLYEIAALWEYTILRRSYEVYEKNLPARTQISEFYEDRIWGKAEYAAAPHPLVTETRDVSSKPNLRAK